MFHTAQWTSEHSMSTPPLKAIRIWAHLTGVPLDLRYNAGLSLVAGLIGDPKETDEFMKNLISLTVSHVKVEVDLTKPLPDVVEFQRQSGEVVEVQVHYPWTPPTCSHCHELGHIIRNCLHYSPPPPHVPPSSKKPSDPSHSSKTPRKDPTSSYHPPSHSSTRKKSLTPSIPSKKNPFDSPALLVHSKGSMTKPLSPDIPRPSLKHPRSSPTFSPTLALNKPPFVPLPSDPVQTLLYSTNSFAILSTDPPNPVVP
ncbi:hypothetical protein DY000_02054553 [Brassica cretica]|uniref:DUF4283 domain-containing protein n=1 Tax=Brassica cretica TaxID=69181 RepID=A0ABQ7A6L5_BRACR|nr:hypothetical protein DY000_02054553 [Brassica cretica]